MGTIFALGLPSDALGIHLGLRIPYRLSRKTLWTSHCGICYQNSIWTGLAFLSSSQDFIGMATTHIGGSGFKFCPCSEFRLPNNVYLGKHQSDDISTWTSVTNMGNVDAAFDWPGPTLLLFVFGEWPSRWEIPPPLFKINCINMDNVKKPYMKESFCTLGRNERWTACLVKISLITVSEEWP